MSAKTMYHREPVACKASNTVWKLRAPLPHPPASGLDPVPVHLPMSPGRRGFWPSRIEKALPPDMCALTSLPWEQKTPSFPLSGRPKARPPLRGCWGC